MHMDSFVQECDATGDAMINKCRAIKEKQLFDQNHFFFIKYQAMIIETESEIITGI
jgi:hypothetical protein